MTDKNEHDTFRFSVLLKDIHFARQMVWMMPEIVRVTHDAKHETCLRIGCRYII